GRLQLVYLARRPRRLERLRRAGRKRLPALPVDHVRRTGLSEDRRQFLDRLARRIDPHELKNPRRGAGRSAPVLAELVAQPVPVLQAAVPGPLHLRMGGLLPLLLPGVFPPPDADLRRGGAGAGGHAFSQPQENEDVSVVTALAAADPAALGHGGGGP